MIIPTILETELSEILHKIDLLKNDATLIQIDLVENHFVNGETLLDTSYLKTINTVCDFELDLMVREPCEHIKSKIEKVKRACAYIKGECLYDFLNLCVANDYLAGLSLAPDDSIDLLKPYAETLDYVEFITVQPGGQGRSFETKSLDNIARFKKLYPDIPVQADGGINEQTIKDLLNLGVRDLVIGSAIFADQNPVERFKKFQEELKNV